MMRRIVAQGPRAPRRGIPVAVRTPMSSLPRTLVVFHSRTGHTRRIGRMLAARLRADIEEIGFASSGAAPGYARCALQAVAGCAAAVRPARHDPAHYDLVLVGTPVWCWSLPAPVRGWLNENRPGPAQVAFFCTMGGSGAERTFAQMRAACGKAPRATLALTEAQLEAGPRAAVDAFVTRLVGTPLRSGMTAAHGPAPSGRPPRAHSPDARGTP